MSYKNNFYNNRVDIYSEYKFLECEDPKCTKNKTINWFEGTITDTDNNKGALLNNLVRFAVLKSIEVLNSRSIQILLKRLRKKT